MNREELKAYLKTIVDLEKRIYTYQNTEQNYMVKIGKLKQIPVVNEVTDEQKEKWKKTDTYKYLEKERNARYKKEFRVQTVLITLIWIAYFAAALWMVIDAEGDDFLVPFAGLLAFALPLRSVVKDKYEPKEEKFKRREDAIMEQYFLQLAQEEVYQKTQAINPPIIAKLRKECEENIITPLEDAKYLLEQLYDMNVLHPKYRSFVIAAQLYEYLDTGRCSELEGPYGAYNLYESELRQNMIIDRLDNVIANLRGLNKTMFYATNAIMDSNRQISQMTKEIQEVKENSSLIAYAAESLAEDSRIAMTYHLHLRNRL